MKGLKLSASLVLLVSLISYGTCGAAQAGGGSHGGAYIAGEHIETVYDVFYGTPARPAVSRKVTGTLLKNQQINMQPNQNVVPNPIQK